MSESTFLSRSFGDQGVRLRIRKEPRTLLWVRNDRLYGTLLIGSARCSKRPASSSLRSDEMPPTFDDPSSSAQRNTTLPSHRGPVGMYNSRYPGLAEPSSKRQRTSVDLTARNFEPDRHSQRSYWEPRAPFGTYPAREQTTNMFPSAYGQGSQSALSNMADYSFGHQRTNSSSTSSPFVSPHTEFSGHSWPSANLFYQPPMKDSSYTYPPNQDPDMQFSRPNQLTEPFLRQRTQELSLNLPSQNLATQSLPSQNLSSRLPVNTSYTFPRSHEPDNSATGIYGQVSRSLPSTSAYPDPSARLPQTDQMAEFASPSRQQYPNTPLSNVLPPLESTLSSGQYRGSSQQVLPSNVLPSIEPQTMASTPTQPVPEHGQESYEGHENYDTTPFSYQPPNQKRSDNG